MKRAMGGRLDLMKGHKNEAYSGELAAERDILVRAKQAALLASGAAIQVVATDNPDANHQEILMSIADLAMEIYAMDSAWLRCVKQVQSKGADKSSLQQDIVRVFLHGAENRLWTRCRQLLANVVADAAELKGALATIDGLLQRPPINLLEPLRRIAAKTLDVGRYPA